MHVLVNGQLVNQNESIVDFMPTPAALDGEVSSVAEIMAITANTANSGKSYYMRGGSYGEMHLTTLHRPASLITFITYPGEYVQFARVTFNRSRNIRFDGNAENMHREFAGGWPSGNYGLWFRGSGTTGNFLPPVPNIMTFLSFDSSGTWTENMQFAHFRLGDYTTTDEEDWRRQHGIVFADYTRDLLFEDFQLSHVGGDMDPTENDFEGGGYGLWWFGTDFDTWGNYTFRRGHWAHTMNDFVQYGSRAAAGHVLFEHCLFEELYNYGLNHADMLQNLGGKTPLTYEGCVFRRGTDWLLHGDNPGGTRLFHNCLFHRFHRITLGKANEGGATDYQWEDCTVYADPEVGGLGYGVDSTVGPAYTSNMKYKNNIYTGFRSETLVVYDNLFATEGEPNIFYDVGLFGTGGLSDDIPGTPVFNSEMECTNFSQGWRKPVGFPWKLG